jgi:hypothetical protein
MSMKTTFTFTGIAVCGLLGSSLLPLNATDPADSQTTASSVASKAGMHFSPGDGQPGHFRLQCHDVSAYDALTAIAKRSGYQLSFDPAGEAICRHAPLTGIYNQPWMGLPGANVESVIVESISANAGLPSSKILRFIRVDKKKGPARVAVVERTNINEHGDLMIVPKSRR